jgi:para-nitrobenzyl esterase
MLWIHGGAFQSGSNALPEYNGEKLAEFGDVVVVTINYRLGCLGFLRLCDISQGDIIATGNEGLNDQITALNWIQDNIHYFGGDKNNVTVFGESAGAMSIGCLLAAPKAQNLFHKAILQSGAAHSYSSIDKANEIAKEFVKSAEQLGFSLAQFPDLTVEQLMAIQTHFLARPEIYVQFGILPFSPVIEPNTLPLAPHQAIADGSAKHISLLAGTVTDEWTFFAGLIGHNIQSREALENALSPLIDSADIQDCLTLIDQQLISRKRSITYQNQLNEIYSDYWFAEPCHRLLTNQIKAGGVAYRYKLGRRATNSELGCTHSVDIGYVFNTIDERLQGQNPRVSQLVNEIQSAWAAFAHHGNSSTSNELWPSYDQEFNFKFFDHNTTHIARHSLKTMEFWSRICDEKLASF